MRLERSFGHSARLEYNYLTYVLTDAGSKHTMNPTQAIDFYGLFNRG